MKFRKYNIFFALSACLITACNNDLKILAPYKSTTVVYGLLDQNDSVHYIRINKSYEGAGNAYQMAKVYDSINYPYGTLNVSLLDYNSNGALVSTINLDSTTTIPLSAGIFSYPHQILYKTTAHLNVNDVYNLIIHNEKTGNTITGSTSLLQDITVNAPFSSESTLGMSFVPDSPTVISWNSTVNGRIYQMTIRFYYTEIINNNSTLDSIDWLFPQLTAPGLAGNFPLQYSYAAQQFFTLLNSSLKASLSITRNALSFKIIFTTGSDDLNTYIQLSQPPIGIDQDVPSFSDVKNGIGIFTSRHTQTFTKGVSSGLADSLVTDPLTQPLNFL